MSNPYDGASSTSSSTTSTGGGGGGFDWGGLFDLAGGALDTFTYTEQEKARDELAAQTQLELAQMQQQSSGGMDQTTMLLAGGAVLAVVLLVAMK